MVFVPQSPSAVIKNYSDHSTFSPCPFNTIFTTFHNSLEIVKRDVVPSVEGAVTKLVGDCPGCGTFFSSKSTATGTLKTEY